MSPHGRGVQHGKSTGSGHLTQGVMHTSSLNNLRGKGPQHGRGGNHVDQGPQGEPREAKITPKGSHGMVIEIGSLGTNPQGNLGGPKEGVNPLAASNAVI